MLEIVRTNLDIEEELWERARRFADQKRYSLTYVVNLALSRFFNLKQEPAPKRPGRPRRPKAVKP